MFQADRLEVKRRGRQIGRSIVVASDEDNFHRIEQTLSLEGRHFALCSHSALAPIVSDREISDARRPLRRATRLVLSSALG
jgi:hypothetical protein